MECALFIVLSRCASLARSSTLFSLCTLGPCTLALQLGGHARGTQERAAPQEPISTCMCSLVMVVLAMLALLINAFSLGNLGGMQERAALEEMQILWPMGGAQVTLRG